MWRSERPSPASLGFDRGVGKKYAEGKECEEVSSSATNLNGPAPVTPCPSLSFLISGVPSNLAQESRWTARWGLPPGSVQGERKVPEPVAMCSQRAEQSQGDPNSCWGPEAPPSHSLALGTPRWENGVFKLSTRRSVALMAQAGRRQVLRRSLG